MWPQPSQREMVRCLARDTTAGPILFRRQLSPRMLVVDHVLRTSLFPLQHYVQRIQDSRLILFVIILLNFHFQKCRDPNPLLDPVGGSKLEPGLLRHFQSKHFVWFYLIFIFKSVATRIPNLTRLANPSWSLVYSDIFNYLPKTFCLCYSISYFLIT